MLKQHVVVDGSNIATEGRTLPSLHQLEAAVAELKKEMPKAEITVVVDATFAHRIDSSELKRFEAAQARGEYISPPAGAIGRGDAFVLKIAEKVNAVVLSNDSFQEFHGEHAWLFDPERLLGASPVPGVGWIFVPRTPVRGPKSRVATRSARKLPPMPVPKTPPPRRPKTPAAEPTPEPEATKKPSGSRRLAPSPEPVNDPNTFIMFIAQHPLGEEIQAEVESFTSHGAIVRFENVQCYIPLSGLGSPPPRSPRQVLERGETRRFVVRGLDPQRRGIELALPGVVDGASVPTDAEAIDGAVSARRSSLTTIPSEVHPTRLEDLPVVAKKSPRKAPAKASATTKRVAMPAVAKAAPKKTVAKAVPKKTVAKAAPKKTAAKKSVEKKPTVKKATPKKLPSTQAVAEHSAAAKKTTAKKTAAKKATGARARSTTSAKKSANVTATTKATTTRAAATPAKNGRTPSATASSVRAKSTTRATKKVSS